MTKRTIILMAFVITKLVLQYFLVGADYELHRDEFLHLDQAHHLAWGYRSIPPVTSWISSLIWFLGNSIFWIRFFPALFGALTIVVVWKAIEELHGNVTALILGATCVLFSALLRLNLLYHPNSLDVLCWTTFYFILIKYIRTENTKWFYIGMIVFAFGFLNKYNIIFLLVGLFPALLLAKRAVFLHKDFYFSLLLCLLLILPNVVWQYNHSFPVFHHLQELAKTQLVNVKRWDFLKDQLIFYIAALPVILAGLYSLAFYPPFRKYRFFFWSMIFSLFVFTYLKAKSYYAIGVYPVYIAFGTVYLGNILKTGWKKYGMLLLTIAPILLFIPLYNIAFPNKSPAYIASNASRYKKLGLLRWEDGKDHFLPQDFADMLGWKELASKVDAAYAIIPDKDHTIILCDNYGQAGAVNYYTKNKNMRALSFNADYIDWIKLDKAYVNVIRVKTFKSKGDELKETGPYFDSAYVAGIISNPFAREYGATIFVFIKAKIDVNKRIRQEIIEELKYD